MNDTLKTAKKINNGDNHFCIISPIYVDYFATIITSFFIFAVFDVSLCR